MLEGALQVAAEKSIKPPVPGLGACTMITHSSLLIWIDNGTRGKRCDMDNARMGEPQEQQINTREETGNATELQLLQKKFDRMK